MQTIIISGNIGKDGQVKVVREQSVLSFPVAVKQGWGDKSATNWYRIQIWGKRAEALSDRAVKGCKVCVQGELTIGLWEGKPQYDIRAQEVEFMGGSTVKQPTQSNNHQDDDDTHIPF